MTENDRFTLAGAQAAARDGDLPAWVRDFLASPGSDNALLGRQLTEGDRRWLQPVLVPLKQLHRLAGPPDEPVLVAVDDDDWRDDVDHLEQKVRDGWEPPPMIATYRKGELVLEDGNHRAEAVRRSGGDEVWTIIGFDDAEAYERFASAWPSVPPTT